MVAQDMVFVVFCELQGKRVVFGNLELKRISRRKTSSNVTTCQLCDVPTSRCANVAMCLDNREKSTSHRDFCLIIIKSNGNLISRHRRTCGIERGKQSSSDSDHWKRHCFCISSFMINY